MMKKLFYIFSLFFIQFSTHAQPTFDDLYNKNLGLDDYKKIASQLNNTSFIFVTGFMSNFQAMSGDKSFQNIIDDMEHLCQSFNCKLDLLHSYEYGMNTVRSSQENSKIIQYMIQDAKKTNIVLVGHSKGGLDITQALLDMMRDKKDISNIKVMNFSTPYKGTPLATTLLNNKYLKYLSKKLFYILNTIDDFKTKKRREKIPNDITNQIKPLQSLKDLSENKNLLKTINDEEHEKLNNKYISFISSYDDGNKENFKKNCSTFYNFMRFPAKIILNKLMGNKQNDGLVPKENQTGIGTVVELNEPLTHNSMVSKKDSMQPKRSQKQVFFSILQLLMHNDNEQPLSGNTLTTK